MDFKYFWNCFKTYTYENKRIILMRNILFVTSVGILILELYAGVNVLNLIINSYTKSDISLINRVSPVILLVCFIVYKIVSRFTLKTNQKISKTADSFMGNYIDQYKTDDENDIKSTAKYEHAYTLRISFADTIVYFYSLLHKIFEALVFSFFVISCNYIVGSLIILLEIYGLYLQLKNKIKDKNYKLGKLFSVANNVLLFGYLYTSAVFDLYSNSNFNYIIGFIFAAFVCFSVRKDLVASFMVFFVNLDRMATIKSLLSI
ncbi:hypothetical protein LJB90_02995 [Eubacteriales bacterium OttesenSCG-928-G02]|nr:hypothetical protein [Eubacteriales bacterium OttesenSCG-928-G02]